MPEQMTSSFTIMIFHHIFISFFLHILSRILRTWKKSVMPSPRGNVVQSLLIVTSGLFILKLKILLYVLIPWLPCPSSVTIVNESYQISHLFFFFLFFVECNRFGRNNPVASGYLTGTEQPSLMHCVPAILPWPSLAGKSSTFTEILRLSARNSVLRKRENSFKPEKVQ